MATRESAHAQIKHQLQKICDMVSKKGLVLKQHNKSFYIHIAAI